MAGHTLDVSRLDEVFDELEAEDRLTQWERGFVESVKAQWEAGHKLSTHMGGQLDTLERIYCKY